MRRAKIAAIALVSAYGVLCLAVALGYRWFLYPAPRAARAPELPPRAELLRIERPGTPPVFAIHAPAPPDAPTLVLFHGNGQDLADEVATVRAFHARGVGVLAVEYPGYGLARDQRATEASIDLAAAIAIEHLDALGVERASRVVVGFSLGTGVAVEMLSRGLASRGVLLAPYTSMPRMVARFVPIVPTGFLIGDAYDSLATAPAIDAPVLVIHGDEDALIPLAMGERLAAALPRATLHIVRGGHHNDLYAADSSLFEVIVAFARGSDTD
ncbi:MAG: alpha/beta fold hydrolase [Polyangiaceae bacterium]